MMSKVISRGDVFPPRHHPSVPVSCRKVSGCCSSFPALESRFRGVRLVAKNVRVRSNRANISTQMMMPIPKVMRWWEKGGQPNMREVTSAQDLVESLENAGEKLVILDFFAPGCGGCRALHPKICQIAKMNPDVQFLQVNHEKHRSMALSLKVNVLPFFRFYRGAHGRVCSFSCTIATIKKFRDALEKHRTDPDSGSLGPAKGLEEEELLALEANKELGFSYTKKPEPENAPEKAPEIVAKAPADVPEIVDKAPQKVPSEIVDKAPKEVPEIADNAPEGVQDGTPPAKGLEKKELLAPAANRELGFSYPKRPETENAQEEVVETAANAPEEVPEITENAPEEVPDIADNAPEEGQDDTPPTSMLAFVTVFEKKVLAGAGR